MGHTAIVNTSTQPGVAYQLLGSWEASDVADRRQDGDGRQHGYSRKLDQQGNTSILGAFLLQTSFDLLDLLLGEIERIQVRAHQELLICREGEALPPGALFRSKGLFRRNQMVAVQHRVQTVLGHGR